MGRPSSEEGLPKDQLINQSPYFLLVALTMLSMSS